MAFAEGTTTLPNDGAASPNYVFGPYDGSAFWHWRSAAAGDGLAAKYVPGVGPYLWNGATVDRLRSIAAAINTGGTGVAAAGVLAYSNLNSRYERIGVYDGALAADGLAPGNLGNSLAVYAGGARFNGVTWDRERGNVEGTAIGSGTFTSTQVSATIPNHNARGVQVVLNITAASGTGGLQLQIQSIDPISGNTIDLTPAPTAITTNGRYAYELGPASGSAGTAGTGQVQQRTSGMLPRSWRVVVGHVNGTSYTYSVSYSLGV